MIKKFKEFKDLNEELNLPIAKDRKHLMELIKLNFYSLQIKALN